MKVRRIEFIFTVIVVTVSIGISLIYGQLARSISRTGLWFFVIIFFALVMFFIIRNTRKEGSDSYEIINPLLIVLTLYSMMLPLNYLVSMQDVAIASLFRYVADPIIFQYTLICLIGLIGLLIGYYSPFSEKIVAKLPVITTDYRLLKIAGLILLVSGMISFATNVASFGGLSNYIKIGYGPQRYVIMREVLAFGSGLELIGISAVLLMFITYKEQRRILFVVSLLGFLFFITVTLLIGQRRYIVYVVLMAFIFFNYGVSHIKLRWVLLVAVVGYLFFFIYGHTRGICAKLGLITGIVETLNFAVKRPYLLLPFVGGEFIPPSKVIVEVLMDNSFQFKYGASYLVGLIRILPRVGRLWPEALRTLSEWRLDNYYPGLKKTGVSFVFFTVGEGFVNFGYLGAFVHMFVYGLVARLIYLYYQRNSHEVFALFLYAAGFSLLLFEGIHAEFCQVFWYVTHIYFGPLFLIIILLKLAGVSVMGCNK